jgi:exonuclease SbcD
MKLLHIADIHLDRVFRSAETRHDADRRRAELRDALRRALAVGREHGVEAVCIAGDTYEHDFVREDTVEFLRDLLASVRVPVLVSPGNHDPYMPGSVWQRTIWPDNVHIFTQDRIEPFALDLEVTVWGAAFTAKHCSTNAVADWRAPDDGGAHVLLIHGALTGEQWADDPGHRPLTRAQLLATGAKFVMLGHFHDGRGDEFLLYPGSLEPLGWGERFGTHGAAVIDVRGDGSASWELHEIARRRYAEETVDVSGATSSTQIENSISAAAAAFAGSSLRVILQGEVEPTCEIEPRLLSERCGGGLAELVVIDGTRPAYDLEAIAREGSVRGRFVARMLASDDPLANDAAIAGLRAMDGHTELVA